MGKLEAGAVHPPPRTPAEDDPWADWAAAIQVCYDVKWQCPRVAPVTLAYLGPKQEGKKDIQIVDEAVRRARSRLLKNRG